MFCRAKVCSDNRPGLILLVPDMFVMPAGDLYIWDLENKKGEVVDCTLLDSPPKYKISMRALGYVGYYSPVSKKNKYYHRFLMNAEPGDIVDHKDGCRMNNTRVNLRLVTASENQINRQHGGNVHYCNTAKKWIAKLKNNNKMTHIASCRTKQGALDAVANYHAAHPERAMFLRK